MEVTNSGILVYRVENYEGKGPFKRAMEMRIDILTHKPTPYGDVYCPDGRDPSTLEKAEHADSFTDYTMDQCGHDWLCGVEHVEHLRYWFDTPLREICAIEGWGLSVYEPTSFWRCQHQVIFRAREARLITRLGGNLRMFGAMGFRAKNLLQGQEVGMEVAH